jgi:hypothetical protein
VGRWTISALVQLPKAAFACFSAAFSSEVDAGSREETRQITALAFGGHLVQLHDKPEGPAAAIAVGKS